MERKRLVYSSLDNSRSPNPNSNDPKPRLKRRKKNRNPPNEHLSNAARIYLHENKSISKNQINVLLKSTNCVSKCDATLKEEAKRYGTLEDQGAEGEEMGRHVNRRRNVKMYQKNLIETYKARYNIRESSCLETERPKNMRSSSGNRLNKPKKEKLALDQYFQKLKSENRNKKLEKIQQMQRNVENNDSIKNLAKIYLSHKQPKSHQKVNSNVISELYQSHKQQKHSNGLNASKNSIRSFNTIENKQRLIPRSIKGYVINEKDQIVSKLLIAQGWKHFGQTSERYTLKWTYNDSFKDYELLRNSEREGKLMYFNHVCNNKLVNKDGLSQIASSLRIKGVETSGWIPETFVVGTQRTAFMNSYNVRTIFTAIHKHYEYFELKKCHPRPQIDRGINENMSKLAKFLIKMDDKCVQNQMLGVHQKQNFVVNIPLLFNLLVLSCNYWACQQGQQSQPFLTKFSHICYDSSIISSLIAFNKADLLFEEYQRFRSTDRKRNQGKESKGKSICIVGGSLKAVKAFMTPSEEVIEAIYVLHGYFSQKMSHKLMGGLRNIWIVKPCTGSRGCGIQIVDRIDKINQVFESGSNKIVQKYIENVWILKQTNLPTLEPQLRKLTNRKFDIRQWALIAPPNSYIFSSFYIRICSKQYDFDSLGDPCSHLSNFSINRDHYSQGEESVMSEKEFESLLEKLEMKGKYKEIKEKIRDRVRLLTDEAMLQCEAIEGTFEVLGFDILLDQDLNPWIIECNMSPACAARTEWLKQMKAAMTIGTLELALDPSLFNSAQFGQCQEFKWEKLSKIRNLNQREHKTRQRQAASSPNIKKQP